MNTGKHDSVTFADCQWNSNTLKLDASERLVTKEALRNRMPDKFQDLLHDVEIGFVCNSDLPLVRCCLRATFEMYLDRYAVEKEIENLKIIRGKLVIIKNLLKRL